MIQIDVLSICTDSSQKGRFTHHGLVAEDTIHESPLKNYRCLFVSCLSEIVCDSKFTRGKSLTVLPLTQLVERNDYVQQTRMEYIGAQFDSLVYNMRPNVCLVLKCHICISIFSRFKREKQKYEYHNDSIQRPGRLFAFVT